MSSAEKNLSTILKSLPDASLMHFGIVVSEWNEEVTQSLFNAALQTLKEAGCPEENISKITVPGSFELPLAAKLLLETKTPDAVICLGCVIQGETRHFDFICDAVSNGIMKLNLDYNRPVIFGVLTTQNKEQALDRSGGKHGNKGVEAAFTALKMVELKKQLKPERNPIKFT